MKDDDTAPKRLPTNLRSHKVTNTITNTNTNKARFYLFAYNSLEGKKKGILIHQRGKTWMYNPMYNTTASMGKELYMPLFYFRLVDGGFITWMG